MHFELDKRRWVLAGITSYGIYCGLPAYAGVYTRASVYHSWLQSIVTNKFDELSINGISSYLTDSTSSYWTDSTSSYSTDSARSLVSPYWSLVLSLYVFANK
jgi:secreted trypsin-like serine protease